MRTFLFLFLLDTSNKNRKTIKLTLINHQRLVTTFIGGNYKPKWEMKQNDDDEAEAEAEAKVVVDIMKLVVVMS